MLGLGLLNNQRGPVSRLELKPSALARGKSRLSPYTSEVLAPDTALIKESGYGFNTGAIDRGVCRIKGTSSDSEVLRA